MEEKSPWVLTPLGRLVTQLIVLALGILSIYTGTAQAVKNSIDDGFKDTVKKAVSADFKRLDDKIDDLSVVIRNQSLKTDALECRVDDAENIEIIKNIEKQTKKIQKGNWGDIYSEDISSAISGYVKLQERNYNSGDMALLLDSMDLIRKYYRGEIGPGK